MKLLLWCLLLLSPLAQAAPVWDEVKATTVILYFGDSSQCSGTAVAVDVILTATHCTRDRVLSQIDDRPAKALAELNDGNDHTLIKVDRKFFKFAKLGPFPTQGDAVFTWGCPVDMGKLLRFGTYSGQAQVDTWDTAIFDLNTWKGDSGSAIFDRHGNIVGLLSIGVGEGPWHMAGAFALKFTQAQIDAFAR